MEKRLFQADQPAMPGGSSEQSAENVTASLVAGHYAVGKEEADGAGVIVDNAERYVGHRIDAIFLAGQVFYCCGESAHEVDIVVGQDVLQDGGDAFKAHAGIDMLSR